MSITPYTSGNYPIYRFYISTEPSSLCCEVFPLNFNDTSLNDQLEKGQIFYRRKFSGKLLFGTNSTAIDADGNEKNRQDDWALLWAYEQSDPCARLYLIITKEIDGDIDIYWDGVFSTSDGFFDIDRCTFEVTPLPNDDYVPIFDLADIQKNILVVSPTVTTTLKAGIIDIEYTRNRWLIDVIEYLADYVLTGVTVSSDYFSDATNYVTLETNHLTLLTIAQKSDIIRPASSDPAATCMLSWNELMNILWAMFQVKWDYDPDTDTINVEHISWWPAGAGIDLRTQLTAVATNKYSYLKEKMPKYEKFAFMEADNINFVGVPIWYDSACVNPDPETNIIETVIPVTTDIRYIYENSNPDETNAIADEGFVILCNYEDGGEYFIEIESGALQADVRANMHLSWANLQNRYFRHNRIMITGYMNDSLETFWTAQKTKKQECSAIICEEFDPSNEITTELGETYFAGAKARVEHSELSPSGKLKLSLLYGPVDNEPTAIEDVPCILIEEGDCGHFYATLSEPAPADMDIIASHEILDSLGAQVCTGGPETWTILTGERESSHNFSLCDSVPAGGCLNMAWDVTDFAGWVVSYIYKCAC